MQPITTSHQHYVMTGGTRSAVNQSKCLRGSAGRLSVVKIDSRTVTCIWSLSVLNVREGKVNMLKLEYDFDKVWYDSVDQTDL